MHLVELGSQELYQELGEEPPEPLAGGRADELARRRLVGDEMTVDLAAPRCEAHRVHRDEIAAELASYDLAAVAVAKARRRARQAYSARPVADAVVSLVPSHVAARYEGVVLPAALPSYRAGPTDAAVGRTHASAASALHA